VDYEGEGFAWPCLWACGSVWRVGGLLWHIQEQPAWSCVSLCNGDDGGWENRIWSGEWWEVEWDWRMLGMVTCTAVVIRCWPVPGSWPTLFERTHQSEAHLLSRQVVDLAAAVQSRGFMDRMFQPAADGSAAFEDAERGISRLLRRDWRAVG